MLLISDRQLYHRGKDHAAGIPFEVEDGEAQQLIVMGHARKAEPPKVLYETKVITPAEVGPTIPFRDGALHNAEPEEVVAASDQVLPSANVRKQGNADPGGRRGRSRFGSRR